jgi:hypothetical protein
MPASRSHPDGGQVVLDSGLECPHRAARRKPRLESAVVARIVSLTVTWRENITAESVLQDRE